MGKERQIRSQGAVVRVENYLSLKEESRDIGVRNVSQTDGGESRGKWGKVGKSVQTEAKLNSI